MAESDPNEAAAFQLPSTYAVGFRRPPLHSRFKPGHSGNPAGRPKGSKNLKTLLNKILKEQVPVREQGALRRVSKGEAIMRTIVIGALKGDSRGIGTFLRVAEQSGHFQDAAAQESEVTQIVIQTGVPRRDDYPTEVREITCDRA